MNLESSPYHTIAAIYCRGSSGELLSVEGQHVDQIVKDWPTIRSQVTGNRLKSTNLLAETKFNTTYLNTEELPHVCICPEANTHVHTALEIYNDTKGCYVGLISCDLSESEGGWKDFQSWLKTFLVLETSLSPKSSTHRPHESEAHKTTEKITHLFDTTLRNISSDDQWSKGSGLFHQRVFDFVIRNDRIQMCLPAFPCKSPNPSKVGGSNPDLAEKIALETLHTFTQDVKKLYAPGATIWIISDGHVFSDCIGTDDQTVTRYDRELQETYQRTFKLTEDHEAVQFRGLTDMLFSNPILNGAFSASWTQLFHIDHPIQSIRLPEVETARQIMMAGFQSSKRTFRKLVEDQHPPTLSLYRGQARFMQDDLCTPEFLAKSSKQKKKLAFIVAAEMIARNQAYSNLVELLYPNYVRLSIHAHTNRGPKFGICLFPRGRVRAIDSIRDRHELVPAYEFQVPTPWHNSIIKVSGDRTIYLGKASIVQTAIDQGEYEGTWVEDEFMGGHFVLTPALSVSTASSVANDLSSMGSTHFGDEKKATEAKGGVMEVVTFAPAYGRPTVSLVVKIQGKVHRILRSSQLLLKRAITPRSPQVGTS